MFFAHEFWFEPYQKVLEPAQDATGGGSFRDAAIIFYHGEARDHDNQSSVLKKFVKNVKWFARKFDTKRVVLHSFNHLSTSKAEPSFVESLASEAQTRLENVGFEVAKTPFGYLNEWKMHVAGESLARVFKEI